MDEKVEILLLEDNPGDVCLIEEMLEEFSDFPYELKNVGTLSEGLSLLKERPFNIILSDLRLPDSDGIDTFLDIHGSNPRIPIIILTTIIDEKIGFDAVKKGAQDYLVKGQVDGRLLKRSIKYSIERKKAEENLVKIEVSRKQEVHHRIKNNLQVISSLLDLQADKFKGKKIIKESEVLQAFKESQDRIISMALIHEELHNDGETDTLNFSHYIEELTDNLFLTYRLGNNGTDLDTDIEEDIFFDMDIAVPLGIIINELISNSLKYAFVDRDEGEIRIELHRDENREYESKDCMCTSFILIVSDNGVGIPEDFDIENLDSLGLQLVTTLVDQLDGELELRRENGTELTIRFTVTLNDNQAYAAAPELIE